MNDMKESIFWLLISILAILFLSVVYSVVSNVECKSKWGDFENRYNFIAGCQVKLNNKWIPAGQYYYKEEK